MATVVVAGHIGNVRIDTTNNGDMRLNASLADKSIRQDKGEEAAWYSFTLFGKHAESMQRFIQKGKFFVVSGDLKPKIYQTQNGESRLALNIYNASLTFGPKDNNDVSNAPSPSGSNDYGDDDIPW